MDSIYKILESLDQVSEAVSRQIKVSNIKWDADDDEDVKDLPTSVTIDVDIPADADEDQVEELVADALTDKYGFTHDGFEMQFGESVEEDMSADDINIEPIDHSDDEDGASMEDISSAITRRLMAHPKFGALVREIDIIDLNDAIEDVAQFHAGGDLGTSDVSSMVNDVLKQLKKEGALDESEVNEEEIDEGNAFITARDAAIAAGKETFVFNGRTYPVTDKDPKDVKRAEKRFGESVSEDYNKDEYDEEGEMAKNQLDVACDATKELKAMIEDDENLPEWVQKKITLAMDYLDTARDYLKSVDDDMETTDEVEFELEEDAVEERKLTPSEKDRMKELESEMDMKDFVERYGKEKGKEVYYATITKMAKKGKKKKKTDETTVAGAVAVGADAAGSNIYGNPSVYESMNSSVEQMITESMNVSVNSSNDPSAEPSVTVSATGEDAMALAQLLQLAAVDKPKTMKVCKHCGDQMGKPMHMDCPYDNRDPMGENFMEVACEDDEANSANNTETYDMEYLLNAISGGLNGQKRQINPNNPGDNPMAMDGNKTVNVEESEDVGVSHLEALYQEFKTR